MAGPEKGMLNNLIVSIPQAQDVPAKNLLISQCTANSTLEAYFKAFLVACRVEGLTTGTIHAYRGIAGEFVRYLSAAGVTYPAQITASHFRLFILSKQPTFKPVSIRTFYRHRTEPLKLDT